MLSYDGMLHTIKGAAADNRFLTDTAFDRADFVRIYTAPAPVVFVTVQLTCLPSTLLPRSLDARTLPMLPSPSRAPTTTAWCVKASLVHLSILTLLEAASLEGI